MSPDPHVTERKATEPTVTEPAAAGRTATRLRVSSPTDPVVAQLRAAGCVFAEQEAQILMAAADDGAELSRLTARRVAGAPLEHIVGWVEFAGRRLAVGPGVFVPRKRSELLAAVTVASAATRERPRILEAYCGAAPLAATAQAWLRDARVYATDVDATALHYARRNLGEYAEIFRGVGLSGLPAALRGTIDVITAVPPYVPDNAVTLLPHEAADHEPHRALLAGPDGLDHLRALTEHAAEWLVHDGVLVMEMNEAQVRATVACAHGFRASVFADDDLSTVVLRLTRTGA